MILDRTAQEIYGRAPRDQMNEWLRTLADIRQLPQTWPTRWATPGDHDTPQP